MTDIASLRVYLKTVIGLGSNQEGTERANAIISLGIEKIADFIDLAKDDGVKSLCYTIRKPAGTIPEPGWVAPNPNPNNLIAPRVAKPSYEIPPICEQRLKTAAYGAKLYDMIGRNNITAELLTKARLREFKNHQEVVENHTEPEALPAISKTFTLAKFLDQFPTYLRELLGTNKVALSYIVREEAIPSTPLPPLISGKPWCNLHTNLMDELVAYAPHHGSAYDDDNARVYTLLVNHLAGSSALVSTSRW